MPFQSWGDFQSRRWQIRRIKKCYRLYFGKSREERYQNKWSWYKNGVKIYADYWVSFKFLPFIQIIFTFVGACSAPTAMLGPAYTLTSTGNLAQAGFSYGSSALITSYTGKTPIENLEEIANKNLSVEKNIKKQTLESDDFYQLVLTKIKKTKDKIVLTNQ